MNAEWIVEDSVAGDLSFSCHVVPDPSLNIRVKRRLAGLKVRSLLSSRESLKKVGTGFRAGLRRSIVRFECGPFVSRVEELEGRIQALSANEFQQLRSWLAEYDADALAGRLDAIAERALKDLSENRSTHR